MEEKELVEAMAALAQESRLAVFRLLVRQGPQGLAAGDIGQNLGIPATTLSFHLSQLSHAGLVDARRNGRSIFYTANYDRVQELVGFLMANCCEGTGGCGPQTTLAKLQGRPSRPARKKR